MPARSPISVLSRVLLHPHPCRRILSRGALFALPLFLISSTPSQGQNITAAAGWTAHTLPARPVASPGFQRLAPAETGITFTNRLSEAAGAANRVLENGSGVAAGDFDADGLVDLFFCGLDGNSALYRNLGGWRFTNVTHAVRLQRLAGVVGRGAVFADLDADRRPDLLVSTLAGGVLCFLNQGGRFVDATDAAGTAGPPGATTLALADVDGNGTPDLYVTRYRAEDIRDSSLVEARRVGTRTELHPRYAGRLAVGDTGLIEYGEPDLLYLNDGRARFQVVPATSGRFLDSNGKPLAAPHRDWGLTATLRDLTGDGLPDLYVCNDYWTPDRFWIQTADGRFRLAPPDLLHPISENSMGIDAADINRDGLVDFLVLDMLDPDPAVRRRQALAQSRVSNVPADADPRPQVMRNTLFRARPDGSFAEIAEFAGLARSGWSWQPLFLDVDLDGWDDVLIPTGHRHDVQDLDATEQILRLQHPWPANLPPQSRQEAFLREKLEHSRLYPHLDGPIFAFRNLGRGRFAPATTDWRLDTLAVHQGAALADLDQDGDLDLAVNVLNGPAGLYRNESPAPRLAVRLQGVPPNTDALGARVRLLAPPQPPQSREVVAGGRYLSGSDLLVSFAASNLAASAVLEITWRNGLVSRIPDPKRDHLYLVDEATVPRHAAPAPPVAPPPLFEQSTKLAAPKPISATRQPVESLPLLRRPVSFGGPGIAAADLNRDGWPDLLVAQVPDFPASIFTNDTQGGFAPDAATAASPLPPLPTPDPGTIVPPLGPMSLGQPDPGGPLHLVVGGAALPGRFPEATPTRILRLTAGAWVEDTTNTAALRDVGLVHAAVWADLDDDGDSDLLLAGEWAPIRAFRSDRGRLVDTGAAWGFDDYRGLWLGLTVADLDADGRLDVIAGNWGLNSSLTASPQQPAALVFGDLLGRETIDVLDAEWDPLRNRLAPRRRLDELETALPPIRALFPTHRAFVDASIDQVIRAFGHDTRRLTITTLASTVFLQRGDRFEAHPLPDEAQVAPVFGVQAADFDGDGHLDLVLAQNCTDLPWPEPPLASGQGLLLRGMGGGALEPMPATRSGIRLDGDQRGLAIADFNQDGRLDLAIGRPSAAPAVFLNRLGRPGLPIRLLGPAANPHAWGATLRLRNSSGIGPAIPLLGGSGWWSISHPETMVPIPAGSTDHRLEVHWPSGASTSHPVPSVQPGQRLVLRHDGGTIPD